MSLEFGLGKANDDLGRYEEAMAHFDRANAIGYKQIVARGGFRLRPVRRPDPGAQGDVYSEGPSRGRHNRAANRTSDFRGRLLRSGTTLVEQILARHPL